MPRLIILRGLPASGKTTYRKKFPDISYLNKDELREQNPSLKEREIHQIFLELVRTHLLQGQGDLILDNTHLSSVAELMELAHQFSYEPEMVEFDTSWQECVERDALRLSRGERGTGRSVIVNMALRYQRFPAKPRQKAVIIDLDGTICNTDHREHFVRGEGKKNWVGFFEALSEDTVNSAVRDLYEMALLRGYTVLFCSGRPDNYRRQTEKWLTDKGLDGYLTVLMRSYRDNRPDNEVKLDLYRRYIEPYFEVQWVIDDRNQVVAMWREQGLTCFQCAPGDF